MARNANPSSPAQDQVQFKSDILRRWGSLKTERSSWDAHWREISDYLLPRSGRFIVTDHNRGTKRHNNIYDSTGTRALRVLAAGMMAGMTSPARPWFRLSTSDPDLAKSAPVKTWLDQCTKLMLTVFQKSNTYRALHSYYEEMGAFGTSAGIVADDFANVLNHTPLTVGEYCIATNWKGEVDTIYREFEQTVGAIVKEFGLENVSINVKQAHERGNLDQWIRLVHAIEPRADRDPTKRDAQNMPWRSVYYEYANSPQGGGVIKPLRESGFKRFPALVSRWAVSGGDIYGNSPGMEALGDLKGLQHKQLRKAEVTDYQTRPPLQLPTSLKNKESETLPGGITYYDGTATSPGIKTMFDVVLNQQHLLEDIQDNRQLIREAFSTDMFLMLSQAQDTRKTATEVAELHEEKMLMLGPIVERLHNELLNPMVDGCFARLIEVGLLPPPPQELHGKPLNVQYTSMLAQAQRAIATNGVDRFVSNLGAIAAFKPDVLDKFDSDEWADSYADMLGVDPQLVVANDKVALIRNQRSQQMQQQQRLEQANQAADTAQKLGSTTMASDTALTALAGGVGRNIGPGRPGQGSPTSAFSGYT